jgi:hypothetical protein
VVLGGLSGRGVTEVELDQVEGDRALVRVDGLEIDGWRPSESTAGSLWGAPALVGTWATGGAVVTGVVAADGRLVGVALWPG